MTRVLVVGGAGYIGSHTCKALSSHGYEPVVFDNLSTGYERNVRWGKLLNGDIVDPAALATAIDEVTPGAIIHFAARAYVGESTTDPSLYYLVNVCGTRNVVEAARRHGNLPLIFSSSCATYGIPDRMPVTEETAQNPVNPYGRTKLIGEQILQDYAAGYGLRFMALRYFNAAGADPDGEIGENPGERTRIIPNAIRAMLNGSPFTIHGLDYETPDGTAIRDYVHVTDLAAAHVAALDALLKGADPAIYNIGTGVGISVREIVNALMRLSGATMQIKAGPRRAGDPPVLVASPTKAGQALGFMPHHSRLETILASALAWHRANPG